MGRERLSFPFILVLSLGAFLLLQHFAYSKEFRRKVTCYNDIFHLDCGNDSFVAVHEAYFTAELQTNQTCLPPPREHDEYIEDEDVDTEPTNNSSCYEDIRVLLNRKCSGLKNCNYSYSDETEKKCSNPEGSYVVRYDCVKVQGCPDLHSTEGSYLLERNGSAAIYACSGNQVFNDTQENTRFLSCVRDHHWNDTLAPCTTLEETTTTTLAPNKSQEVAFEYVNATSTKKPIMPSGPAYLEDIIIPSILIGVLIIGNAIIIVIILMLRSRQKDEDEEVEQLSQANPSP
ncbi:uncharacterized protein LOC118205585 isoform X3 [Stegodyphus dumicola]|uniref:uncharacterized protein LOC118205585 isoform X3 n=1 Tax=Stegodyphus dumicola TaxID=202533 RepID=UPI0015B06BAE|nr:uncharacterized protein LOC118205585 isoform X3 [Stegodyphus dumicola]